MWTFSIHVCCEVCGCPRHPTSCKLFIEHLCFSQCCVDTGSRGAGAPAVSLAGNADAARVCPDTWTMSVWDHGIGTGSFKRCSGLIWRGGAWEEWIVTIQGITGWCTIADDAISCFSQSLTGFVPMQNVAPLQNKNPNWKMESFIQNGPFSFSQLSASHRLLETGNKSIGEAP